MTFTDPCTTALLTDKMMMQIHTNNPYVETLIEMGYDAQDCHTVANVGVKKTFPCNIHGRVFETQEEYDEALHDFLNGMW
jgi:hypothetical protein